MSKGGSSKNQTTTTTTEPPKYLQPFLQDAMQGAQGLYRGGPAQYYPGQTVVGFSPDTENALGMISSRAQAGSPVTSAANSYATDVLNGGQSNPWLDSTFNHAADATQGRLQGEFASSGRNLGAAEPARAEELNNLATDIYGGQYNNDQNRRIGVLGMSPQLANADYTDANALLGVGAQREDLTGRQYQDAANRWDFSQNAPGQNLDQYLARLGGYPGSAMSQSTPIYRNPLGGAIGGGMLGSQIGSQFGGNGGMYGGLLGSLAGYFGG